MAKTLEISHVPPFADLLDSLTDFSLPLTFSDNYWFKFPPVERLLFYSLPQPKPTFLISTLPKLKHTLSLTLLHFLPLAGNLTWPPDFPIPIVLYTPNGGVSLTVAESDAADDFDLLSGDHVCEAALFHPFIPKLNVTETGASVLALQITLFPDRGFSVGVTCHHAFLDGKSTTMFMKAWAHICRSEQPILPPELTPFFDRSVIRDPDGLDSFYVKQWLAFAGITSKDDDPNLFQFLPSLKVPSDFVRATFQLTRADIAKLTEKVLSSWDKPEKLRLTSFAVTYSYIALCTLRATEDDFEAGKKNKFLLGFTADFRNRLKPAVPENYFGNCVGPVVNYGDLIKTLKESADKEPLTVVAAEVNELMKKLEEDVMEGAAEEFLKLMREFNEKTGGAGVAGSPRFGVYEMDFGWGRPEKVDIVSVDRTGAMALAESRDGSGGIEIGVVFRKHQMDVFSSLFHAGLENQV